MKTLRGYVFGVLVARLHLDKLGVKLTELNVDQAKCTEFRPRAHLSLRVTATKTTAFLARNRMLCVTRACGVVNWELWLVPAHGFSILAVHEAPIGRQG